MSKRKKLKEGYEKVDIFDLDSHNFKDMMFFDKYVPEGCKLESVSIYAEYGYYDEGDGAYFIVNWKEKDEDGQLRKHQTTDNVDR